MEWRILVKYEKVIIPSIEKERTLLIYMRNLKINMAKRIKSIFCFTVICRRLWSIQYPSCKMAELLHETEDRQIHLPLGHSKIFSKKPRQDIF